MRKLIVLAITALLISPAAVADTGTGVKAFKTKHFAKALKELTPAAKVGDPDPQFHLALMYSGGFGVRKNPAKALDLYRQAAELVHVPAQINMERRWQSAMVRNRISPKALNG